MWDKVATWFKKFWGLILGLAIIIGLLAGIADIIEFFHDIRPPTLTPSPSPTVEPTSTQTATPLPTPSPTSTMGPFQFLVFPTQIKAGAEITISLQATPEAVCFLDYYTPDGNKSSARGLGLVFADSRGKCTWTWRINANTLPGTAKLDIALNDIHETHEFEIVK